MNEKLVCSFDLPVPLVTCSEFCFTVVTLYNFATEESRKEAKVEFSPISTDILRKVQLSLVKIIRLGVRITAAGVRESPVQPRGALR